MHSLKDGAFDKLHSFLQHELVLKLQPNLTPTCWCQTKGQICYLMFCSTSIVVVMCKHFRRIVPVVDLD
jgi:hypothetical protein